MVEDTLEKVGWKHEPQSVKGKSVIVTGGTTGIGRATALLLAAHGANVTVFGRREESLQEALRDLETAVRDGGEAFGLTADQGDPGDVQRVFREAESRFGGVDIAVANAALAARSVTEMDYDEIEQVVRVNVLGYMAVAREFLARAVPKGDGHLVLVGSMSADAKESGSDVYVATKTAVAGFADSLRKQVNEKGIRVTLVEPGSVGSNLSGEADADGQRAKIAEMAKLAAEDIAAAIHFAVTQPKRSEIVTLEIKPLKQII